jgi:hypothetical protein
VAEFRKRWNARLAACSLSECTVSRRSFAWIRGFRNGIRLEEKWYCTPRCFEIALCNHFRHLMLSSRTSPTRTHRVPLGLLLLSRGQLAAGQLNQALDAQCTAGYGRLGDWLQKLGFSNEDQIMAALGVQWSCPVLSSTQEVDPRWMSLLPRQLEESFRMVPLHFSQVNGMLHVGFAERIDYTVLYAAERMLSCRTTPCLVSHRLVERAMSTSLARPTEIAFESPTDAGGVARITCNYAVRLGAEFVRSAVCGDYLWVRLASRRTSLDALFRISGTDSLVSSERALSLPRKSTAVTE